MSVKENIAEMSRFSEDAKPSKLHLILRKMWHLRLGVLGAVLLFCLLTTAVFCPILSPHDPLKQNIMKRLRPPVWLDGGTSTNLLGTDHLGRDILSRIMYGSRISLVVGVAAVMLQVIIGVALGLLAGYHGGKIDSIISFMVNSMTTPHQSYQ